MGGAPLAHGAERSTGVTRLRALGTKVTLAVARPDALAAAESVLRNELDAIDRAASRFRSDSEIWNLYAACGRPVRVTHCCTKRFPSRVR
jgi:FAD:protein FMN transferase